jgi:hypothetical protein
MDVHDVYGLIKKLSLGALFLGVLFLTIRFELMKVHSVPEGSVAPRTRWEKPRYYRSNRQWLRFITWMKRFQHLEYYMNRKGRLVVLPSGGHLLVKGMHGAADVNLREELLTIPAQDVTFKGRTLHLGPLEINWRLDWQDTPEGDRLLENRLWFVADTNILDGTLGNYEAKLLAVLRRALSLHLKDAEADPHGFPMLKLKELERHAQEVISESEEQLVAGRLTKFTLPVLTALTVPPMAWTGEQVEGDKRVEAAEIEAKARIQAAQIMASQLGTASGDSSDTESLPRPTYLSAVDD